MSTTPSQPDGSRPSARWARWIAAFLLWTAILAWRLGWPVTALLPESIRHALPFLDVSRGLLILIGIGAAFTVIWGFGRVIRLVLYLAVFPVWAPLLLLGKGVGLAWHLAKPSRGYFARARHFAGQLHRSPISAFVHLILVPYLAWAISAVTTPALIKVAMVGILYATVVCLCCSFSLSPTFLIVHAGSRILAFGLANSKSGIFTAQLRQTASSKEVGDGLARLGWLLRITNALEKWIAPALTLKAMVLAFAVVFLTTFVILVVGFGFAYLGAWRLDSTAFGCDPVTPNAVDAVFFSLTTITTSAISSLCPRSVATKTFVALELLCGLTLVSLLAMAFSTFHSTDLHATNEKWKGTLGEARTRLDFWETILKAAKKAVDNDPNAQARLQAVAKAAGEKASVTAKWAEELGVGKS